MDSTSWDSRFRNTFFSICSTVQNVLYVKNSCLFSFSNVLKKKCLLSLPVVLLINSVKNRCISNTWSTFNWQHFLPTELLLLNDFLFAPLKKSLVGMYNINEKNSNIKITGRTFPENLNYVWWWIMMTCFCGMFNRKKVFRKDHCQR